MKRKPKHYKMKAKGIKIGAHTNQPDGFIKNILKMLKK